MWSKIKKAAKTVGRVATSAARMGVNAIKEGVNRFLGIPGWIAYSFGIRWPMKIRLRVVILRDQNNDLVADPKDVLPSIQEAQEIFKQEANIRIEPDPFTKDFFLSPPTAAPKEVLDVRCGSGALLDEFGAAGRYFNRWKASRASSFFVGYATPLTVFIVNDIRGKKGCSLGPLVDYVTVDLSGLSGPADPCAGKPVDPGTPPGEDEDDDGPIVIHGHSGSDAHRTMAHEIGHACGLTHAKSCRNLMHTPPNTSMTKRQQVWVRNSRYVSTF